MQRAAAPLAGFIYLIFNPRFTWLKGTIGLLIHTVRQKLAQPGVSLRAHAASYQTRYWKSAREYRHMLWNNLVLLSIWALMCWVCGTAVFFSIYLLSVSIAGGAGIVLFTVQHNFEHSYASDNAHWDPDTGAIEGTSFLVLAALAELVHRQYRLSPHSPPVGQYSELLSRRVSRRVSASVFGRHPREVVRGPRAR